MADSLPRPLVATRRPLVLGIGGGGDVVGALATAETLRQRNDAHPMLGGVSWERLPIDPQPGPRSTDEIRNALEIARGVLVANAHTRTRSTDVRFAEARIAELLGEDTLLIDGTCGPATLAAGIRTAISEFGCDLAIFLDVGGDVLARGDEAGLGSPLCDSVLLAAAVLLQRMHVVPVLGAVFGAGCDGELTPAEVRARLAELDEAGGLADPPLDLDDAAAEWLERAVTAVPTEASAQPLRAYRGERGQVAIRGGRRTVTLTVEASRTTFFDPEISLRSAAPLAAAVINAHDLNAANDILHDLGVRTELDYERDMAAKTAEPPTSARTVT